VGGDVGPHLLFRRASDVDRVGDRRRGDQDEQDEEDRDRATLGIIMHCSGEHGLHSPIFFWTATGSSLLEKSVPILVVEILVTSVAAPDVPVSKTWVALLITPTPETAASAA